MDAPHPVLGLHPICTPGNAKNAPHLKVRCTPLYGILLNLHIIPKNKREAYASLLFLLPKGTQTHFYTSVWWTLAETSANTGFYIYFLPALRGKKMQIESLLVYY